MEELEALTKTEVFGVGGILGAALATYVLFVLVWAILQIVAKWKIFTKAGEAGWKSLIPIYNEYTQYKFTWSTNKFWVVLIISIIISILSPFLENVNSFIGVILAIIVLVLTIMELVYYIKSLNYLAKSFGKGTGFTLGLIFLNPIFLLILGFGKVEYIGNQSKK